MLVKLGIAAAALTYATVSLASVDYRQLYNEMYPVNGLKRGVLGLCQAAKPTFVRAIEQDRVDCYDSMPNSIERAIGWVKTSARLAAMRTPSGVELAEKLLQEAELRQRGMLFASIVMPASAGSAACDRAAPEGAPVTAAKALSLAQSDDRQSSDQLANDTLPNDKLANDQLARRIASGDGKLLAELGLAKPGARPDAKQPGELPILPLAGSSGPGPTKAAAPPSDPGGSAPPLASSGCGKPA